MIHSIIRMKVPSKKREEALKILKLTAEFCRVQPGCLSCNVYEDLQEKNTILFSGKWQSREDLDRHLRSDEYRNVLFVIEMAEKEPEILFDEISGSTGIETVEKARRSNQIQSPSNELQY